MVCFGKSIKEFWSDLNVSDFFIGVAWVNYFFKWTFNTAFDFRGRLRFPRVAREPPRLRLRGLTLATFPAGVFVFHSNQKLG